MGNILIRELVTWNENFGSEYLRERSKSLSKNQSNKNSTVLKTLNRRFREKTYCEGRLEHGVKKLRVYYPAEGLSPRDS